MGKGEDLAVVSPSVTDRVVHVASYRGQVHALDANTGTLRWLFEADDVSPPALVAGGVVHVNGYALDASTEKMLWQRERDLSPGNSHYFSATKTAVYTAAYSDTVIELRALDAASGASLWKDNLPRRSDEFFPPLFPITAAFHFLRTGPFERGTAMEPRNPSRRQGRSDLAADGVLYLSDFTLRALNASTGEPIWSFAVDQEKSDLGVAVTEAHVAADGMVFVSTVFTYEPQRNSLHALKAATGDPVWSLTNSIGITPMTLADGIVYAHSLDGRVHAIDAWTGEIIWSFDVNYQWWRQPFAVSNGVMYVFAAATGTERPTHGVYALAAPKPR